MTQIARSAVPLIARRLRPAGLSTIDPTMPTGWSEPSTERIERFAHQQREFAAVFRWRARTRRRRRRFARRSGCRREKCRRVRDAANRSRSARCGQLRSACARRRAFRANKSIRALDRLLAFNRRRRAIDERQRVRPGRTAWRSSCPSYGGPTRRSSRQSRGPLALPCRLRARSPIVRR